MVVVLRDAVKVVQFNLRAFFSVRTWPWMMLFYKLRPMLRSAQVEKELATLNEDFSKLKDAFERSVSVRPSRRSPLPSVTGPFHFQVRGEAPGGGGPTGGLGPGEERPGSAAPDGETLPRKRLCTCQRLKTCPSDSSRSRTTWKTLKTAATS